MTRRQPRERPSGTLTITVWPSVRQPHGRRVRTSWTALAARAANPSVYTEKYRVPRWSPALFRDDYRRLANVERVAAVVLDIDDGTARERVVGAFGAFVGFAHTTVRSTPERPRWRLVMQLTRDISAAEYARCWRAVAALAERAGITPDYSAGDASRAWAVPACHTGGN